MPWKLLCIYSNEQNWFSLLTCFSLKQVFPSFSENKCLVLDICDKIIALNKTPQESTATLVALSGWTTQRCFELSANMLTITVLTC